MTIRINKQRRHRGVIHAAVERYDMQGRAADLIRVFICLSTALLISDSALPMEPRQNLQGQNQALAQAEKQAGSGNYGEAARAYEALAAQANGEMKSRLFLRAARYWLNAGDLDKAQASLNNAGKSLPPSDVPLRATVAADLALRTNQPERALSELDQVSLPLPGELAPEILKLRSNAQFALNRPLPAINSALDRERLLSDGASITQNRQAILNGLKQSAAKGADLTPPAGVNAIVAGWLELGRLNASLANNPFALREALTDWRKRYPTHPGASLPELQDSFVAGNAGLNQSLPAQIAVLLPLSGRQQSAGVAVRDGLMAALLQQNSATRPTVNVYDTATVGAANAYQQAVNAGAAFVIGPLTKEEVGAIASTQQVAVPTLALNYLPDTQTAPGLLFQFALDPEEEARQAASRIAKDGYRHGVALLPNNDWGQRVLRAFEDELKTQGGTLANIQYYETNTRDFSNVITGALLITESRARAKALTGALGANLQTEARARSDVDFVFIGAQAAQGRLLRPALRFFISNLDMPVYATSDIYEVNEQANADLNDVRFPDMPWMIAADEKTQAMHANLRRYWPNSVNNRDRLYAFGYDAFQLIPLLNSQRPQASIFSGMTGRLAVDANGRIRRQLDWARISAGQAVPLPSEANIEPAAASLLR